MWLNLLRSPLTWLLLALAVALGGWGWSARSAAKAEGQVTTLQSDLKAASDKAAEADKQTIQDHRQRIFSGNRNHRVRTHTMARA